MVIRTTQDHWNVLRNSYHGDVCFLDVSLKQQCGNQIKVSNKDHYNRHAIMFKN